MDGRLTDEEKLERLWTWYLQWNSVMPLIRVLTAFLTLIVVAAGAWAILSGAIRS